MKKITINLHETTYQRAYNLIERAKEIEFKNTTKKPTTTKDIEKLFEKLINDKSFQEIIKTMEDLVYGINKNERN